MQLKLLAETVAHLKLIQVAYQVKAKVSKPKFEAVVAPDIKHVSGITTPIAKYPCYDRDQFNFLNIADTFHSWNQIDHGMLWAYNLNYMDWLNQEGLSVGECERWIDLFIDELPQNHVGLDPYPIALRAINWIKFFCKSSDSATKHRLDSLYSQIKLLEKKLEYRLLGNHLLEDAYALFIASIYFNDQTLYAKASNLLKSQLKEQILEDGAHYEQSPMYHCILLDRLLDCLCFSRTTDDMIVKDFLEETAKNMLGHLESVAWEDGSIPLLNDAAYGIAPTPGQLFDYAYRLGLSWNKIPMKDCGYRKFADEHLEAIVDVGNITASYQPGHTHADTFNFELRIGGKPYVVDTGISTYNKTERRQLERSTIAHNTVSVDGKNSSDVWGGFRVGKRCHTEITEDTDRIIVAAHNGFGKECRRKFEMNAGCFTIEDWYDGDAVSYIHLAEGADEKRVNVEGAEKIEAKSWEYSTLYNQFHVGKVMEIHFKGNLKYTIQ